MDTPTPMNILPSYSSCGIPFSIFRQDLEQYSLCHMKDDDTKTFLWHQFMLDVLFNIPCSPIDNQNIIEASRHVNEIDINDSIDMKQVHIDEFLTTYTSDKSIKWYTRDSFLYRAFNKACRIVDSDLIIQFHSFVKDLNNQLQHLYLQQKDKLYGKRSLTVYRGQAFWNVNELKKFRESKSGDLIAMNTFLSTTINRDVALGFILGADKNTSVMLQITINGEVKNDTRTQIFADIKQFSDYQDEEEILFGMSTVFKLISIEDTDYCMIVNLELTDCKTDENVKKLMNEVKSHLYEISGKQIPFYIFKQLFTTTSHGHFRSFTELMKFVLADLTQIFVINMYKKEYRMKELIDTDNNLLEFINKTNNDIIRSSERSICLLFDLLNRFLYSSNKTRQEQISFNLNDKICLLCFGGFLFLIGESNKSIRYFEILLKNDWIDDELKILIYTLFGAGYTTIEEKELASKYFSHALQSFESSTQTSFIRSSHSHTLDDPDQQGNEILLNIEQSFLHNKQFDNDINEKIRLLILGNRFSEEQKLNEALNHWEEALEIISSIPFTIANIFNGIIYLQMATVYCRLNKTSEALNFMEKGFEYMKCYYPSTHRMFATFYFLYGYFLIQNEKSSQAIKYLEKALVNPYFSTNKDFLSAVYSLLVMGSIQSGNINCAEQYCYKALQYQSSTNSTNMISIFLEGLPHIKMMVDAQGTDYARQVIGMSLQLGQQMLSKIIQNCNLLPDINDDQTNNFDKFITYADHYRHQQDYRNAEIYYSKALEIMTQLQTNHMWNIYRKMMRMNKNNNCRYRDYFIEQYSKYDENNPEDFQIISTLQIIMYKFCLEEDEFDLGFDCLIYGTFISIKSFVHQIKIDSNSISNLLNSIFHHQQFAQLCSILTKSIEIYSNTWIKYLQDFFHIYFTCDELYTCLAKIIHHPQIDNMIEQIKSKYINEKSSNTIFLFLNTLLKFIRQSIPVLIKSKLSFSNKVLQFVRKYDDPTVPIFFVMKTVESLIVDDIQSFSIYLDKLRMKVFTLDNYNKFKQKISDIFSKLEEDQLLTYLENIAKK
ncbi:unnamed protein product [Adineta steineri]|uniref:NAD(P)(+)--arginine ADP-ribosyltransferase n=1 Tax=Adineta steineri TaxID=433720 RepID=A0A814IKI8_9BILA|nr:unnamed protein product [Adineta steineri]CAF3730130.1 unnamed protein product [Adineta steineri]